jgi:hypothetical protein
LNPYRAINTVVLNPEEVSNQHMQYHKAAFLGTERSRKAQMKLFNYTGFAMLTYTIKQSNKGFEPVGEEMLTGSMTRGNEMMLFICDNDGYAKAQSKPLTLEEGQKIVQRMLQDGLEEFKGDIRTVS